jgi:S-adenosylmethionine:tRNA ribosyltransferase-isomerase
MSGSAAVRRADTDGTARAPDAMRLAAYDYALPPAAIAQRPAEVRDAARLLVLERRSDRQLDRRFADLPRHLVPGDVLVVNDSRVVPARLRGRKDSGGRVEVLLLAREAAGCWVVLARASRRPRPGATVDFGCGVVGEWLEELGAGRARVQFRAPGDLEAALAAVGEVPLPPYVHRPAGPDAADRERYQTVYAREPGSIAAPTAGLHFTAALLGALRRAGVTVAPLTLHVGAATFRPIPSADLRAHRLESERYTIPPQTAAAVSAARSAGRRVIAVGTTTTRALEAAAADGTVRPGPGVAALFIGPGHRFRVIDGLVTNFHLPRSSLLVLVCAFAGRARVLGAYAAALARGYRFYSYGDAMLIV